MGFSPQTPGKAYRELEEASLLRRAAHRPGRPPAIVGRLPLQPPTRTPVPIRIDPAEVPAVEVVSLRPPTPRPPTPHASPDPTATGVTLNSGPVRMSSARLDSGDDYLSICLLAPRDERMAPWTRRAIILLAVIATTLLAIWLFRRSASAGDPTLAAAPAPTASFDSGPAARALRSGRTESVARPEKAAPVRISSPAHPERSGRPAPAKSKGARKASRSAARTAAPAPAPAVESAWLTVDAVPYGTVWIDGRRAGETPLIRVRLDAGNHEVRVVSGTGVGRTFVVDLAAGADVRRRIRFEDER